MPVVIEVRDGESIDVTYGDHRYGYCECGCNFRTNWRSDGGRSSFLPGHDAKLKSRLVRLGRAGDERAIATLRERGWEHFLAPRAQRRSGRNGTRGRKFGVELEIVGITRAVAMDVLSNAGISVVDLGSYTHRVSQSWKVVTDASLSNSRMDGACEVVSPPLRGRAGFEALKTVMEALSAAGARVNVSCGTHVHHDINDLTGAQVADLLAFYVNRQAAFDQVVAPSRRDGRWCHSWSRGELENVLAVLRRTSGRRTARGLYADRFKTINIMSYPKYGTIEIRQHQGTLNYAKLERWIKAGQFMIDAVKAGRDVRTDLVGMMHDLGFGVEDVQWFAERAQGFGFLASFDAEDLEMSAAS